MTARRYAPRSRQITAKVIKPKRGQYLLPIMVVHMQMPDFNRLNGNYKKKRGAKSGRNDHRDHHIAYEVIRLARGAKDMTEAQAIPASKRAVAIAFGCDLRTVTSALGKYRHQPEGGAEGNQLAYSEELQRQGLLGK